MRQTLKRAKIKTDLVIFKGKGGTGPLAKDHATSLFGRQQLVMKLPSDRLGGWETSCESRCFHGLRYCYATEYAIKIHNKNDSYTVSLQSRMGHSRFSTTKQYLWYAAILEDKTEVAGVLAEELDNDNARRFSVHQ